MVSSVCHPAPIPTEFHPKDSTTVPGCESWRMRIRHSFFMRAVCVSIIDAVSPSSEYTSETWRGLYGGSKIIRSAFTPSSTIFRMKSRASMWCSASVFGFMSLVWVAHRLFRAKGSIDTVDSRRYRFTMSQIGGTENVSADGIAQTRRKTQNKASLPMPTASKPTPSHRATSFGSVFILFWFCG